MKKLVIALAVAAASIVFAAEPPPEDPPDPKPPPSAANEPVKGKAPRADTNADPKGVSSPDVFVPSESISEDLAIPLPVDI